MSAASTGSAVQRSNLFDPVKCVARLLQHYDIGGPITSEQPNRDVLSNAMKTEGDAGLSQAEVANDQLFKEVGQPGIPEADRPVVMVEIQAKGGS